MEDCFCTFPTKILDMTISDDYIDPITGQKETRAMRSFSVSDFKAHALGILNGIAETGESVLVTKRGKPIACVSPCAEEAPSTAPGRLKGTLTFSEDLIRPVLPGVSECTKKAGGAGVSHEVVEDAKGNNRPVARNKGERP